MMKLDYIPILLNSAHSKFEPGEFDSSMLAEFKKSINDESYYSFILRSGNGGFYLNQSLQIYGYSPNLPYNDIRLINKTIAEKFGEIAKDLICFAQDLFGNQFSFSTVDGKVYFFNVETGDREWMADNFNEWIDSLFADINYYSGKPFAELFLAANSLNLNQRICLRIPSILNGEYELNNVFACDFPEYFKLNASIAKQVFGLPDGTPFKIVPKK